MKQSSIYGLKSRLLVAAVAAIMTLCITEPCTAQMKKGEAAVGVKAGYVTKNKSAMAGVTFQYAFSEHFRLSPEVGYIFRNDNLDAFLFDINAQVPFDFSNDRVALYPLAGLAYRSWNHHVPGIGLPRLELEDVSTRHNRVGANLGAGVEMRLTRAMKISFEFSYTLIHRYSCARFTGGIAYVF